MRDSEFLDGPDRERVRVRLQRFVTDAIERELAPLFHAQAAAARDPALRGSVHRLIEAGGVVPGATEAEVPAAVRGALKALGVRAGRFALFMPVLLKPRAVGMRAQLWALAAGVPTPDVPAPGRVSLPAPEWPSGFGGAIGFVDAGPVLLRLDVAERVAAELAYVSRVRPAAVPDGLASRLSIRADMLPAVLRALGVRLTPAASLPAEAYGPPAPPMMLTTRRAKPEPPTRPPPRQEGPFAALVGLRR